MKEKNLKIWDENKKVKSEDDIYLRLEQPDEDTILLVSLNENGKKIKNGIILMLNMRAKVFISMEGISDDIPLKTDLKDCPLFYTEWEFDNAISTSIRKQIHAPFEIIKSILSQKISEIREENHERKEDLH